MKNKKTEYDQIYDNGYFHGKNSGYPEEGYENEHPVWRLWIDFAKNHINPKKWLDVGCAYGYLVSEARAKGINAVGIDVSSYALEQIPELKDYVNYGDGHCLDFNEHSFDVVSCFDILEHMEDPKKCLLECKRVLRPGGVAYYGHSRPCLF